MLRRSWPPAMHGPMFLHPFHDLVQLLLLLGQQVYFHFVLRLLEDCLDFRLMPLAHVGQRLKLGIHNAFDFDLLGLR